MDKTNNTYGENLDRNEGVNKNQNQNQNTANQGANMKNDFGQKGGASNCSNTSKPNNGPMKDSQNSSCSNDQKASGSCKRTTHTQDEDTGTC